MKFARSAVGIAAVATLALSLSACSGGKDEETTVVTSDAPISSPTASASAEAEPTAPNAPSGDIVEPGATVSMNEAFTIPSYEILFDDDYNRTGQIMHGLAVSFDGLRAGSADDFAATLSPDNVETLRGYDIAYFDYTVTQVDGFPMEKGQTLTWGETDLTFRDNQGTKISSVIISFDGGPEQCKSTLGTALQDTGTASACIILVIPKGNTLDSAEYDGYSIEGEENLYADNPAIWKYEG